ncbi:hypothetical protein [Streptomyces sp. AM 2-1-1]|uniref:hypothetical protein n=1 Tax=Streptomyces sp. AM 2-1-1 TaxID=3028709 RepID=UPI0023B8C511|nr:hypothetical protein [Streptomyces sp. AM 2-1-1]WEH38092.1 hypothetical protein PZB77_00385 [Streptomyces sp. AM 2-1-1]
MPDPDALVGAVRRARAAGGIRCAWWSPCPDNLSGTIARAATVSRLAEAARELDLVVVPE